jgi:hypothetical protein
VRFIGDICPKSCSKEGEAMQKEMKDIRHSSGTKCKVDSEAKGWEGSKGESKKGWGKKKEKRKKKRKGKGKALFSRRLLLLRIWELGNPFLCPMYKSFGSLPSCLPSLAWVFMSLSILLVPRYLFLELSTLIHTLQGFFHHSDLINIRDTWYGNMG